MVLIWDIIWIIVVGGICGFLAWWVMSRAKQLNDTQKLLISMLFSILAGIIIAMLIR